MSAPGDEVTNRAIAIVDDDLDWQDELDSAMADIDVRLRHPRRRASDQGQPPTVAELSQVKLTAELLDEIAWRVSEQIRRSQAAAVAAAEPAPVPSRPTAVPTPVPNEAAASNAAMVIRLRTPLFKWPRWSRRKRKQHPLTTVKLSA